MRPNLQFETIGEALVAASEKPGVSHDHAEVIDQVYLAAISADPSPRNRIAYGRYLAEHGRFIDGMLEFGKILEADPGIEDADLLSEIVRQIIKIEARLEEDDTFGRSELQSIDRWEEWNDDVDSNIAHADHPFTDDSGMTTATNVIQQLMGEPDEAPCVDVGHGLAGLDSATMHEVAEVLTMLWADRMAGERRRTGLTLLKLALFCGRYSRCEVEVACIRRAITCFQQAATELQNSRLRCSEPAAVNECGSRVHVGSRP